MSDDILTLGLIATGDSDAQNSLDALRVWCDDAIVSPCRIASRIVENDFYALEDAIRDLTDHEKCNLVLTVGGIEAGWDAPADRATRAIATQTFPGFAEQMRRILSRVDIHTVTLSGTAALRATPRSCAIIVNLPAKPLHATLTLSGLFDDDGRIIERGIFPAILHLVAQLGGPVVDYDDEPITDDEDEEFEQDEGTTESTDSRETDETPKVSLPILDEESLSPAPIIEEELPENSAPEQTMPTAEHREPVESPPATATVAATAATASAQHNEPEFSPQSEIPRGVPLFSQNHANAPVPLTVFERKSAFNTTPAGTLIWLHGLGTDASDFASLASDFSSAGAPALRILLPQAPVIALTAHAGFETRAWYDFTSDRFGTDCEIPESITRMHLSVSQIINRLISEGTPAERIFLGGFSQGAAMSLYCGLRQARTLGGIIAASGYLPLASRLGHDITPAGRRTPVFMAHGEFDDVIGIDTALRGYKLLDEMLDTVIWRHYSMTHEMCHAEIVNIVQFLLAALDSN